MDEYTAGDPASNLEALKSFVYQANSSRILFGAGSSEKLAEEIQRLGRSRALILSTPSRAAAAHAVNASLGSLGGGVYANATMHTPVPITQEAIVATRESGADCLVSLGGGSTTGLGKAIATRTGIPHIAIPTTYAGSEVTPILGETENNVKSTRRDSSILPQTVIYDVSLTTGLSVATSVTSGVNALAHAIEALYAEDANPITDLMAEAGAGAIVAALPRIAAEPHDTQARAQAQYGAWLSGTVLGSVAMGLHHRICHVLGGFFDLPHAEMHTVLLPYVVGFNTTVAPAMVDVLGRALGQTDQVAQKLQEFIRRLGGPTALKDIGMPEEGLSRVAEIVAANPYRNPRPVSYEQALGLMTAAYSGAEPSSA